MKRIAYLAVAAALFAPAAAPATLEPVAPAEGAVAPLLSAGQKAYLSMPRAERVAYFASQSKRNEMVKLEYWPQPGAFGMERRKARRGIRRFPETPARREGVLFGLKGSATVFFKY